jgi:hypothetical protein
VRVRLSNAYGTASLVIGAAHIALRSTGAEIIPGSDRVLTFSGESTIAIPPAMAGAIDLSLFRHDEEDEKRACSLSDNLGESFRNRWVGSQLSIQPTSLDPEARNRPGTDDFFILPEFQKQVILPAVEPVR